MDYTIVRSLEELEAIKEEWEQLEHQDPELTYYSTYQYHYDWWRAYGGQQERQLYVICKYHRNRIIGLAPLMTEKARKWFTPHTVLKFIGNSPCANFLTDLSVRDVGITKELFRVLEMNAAEWNRIEFSHIEDHSILLKFLLKNRDYNPHVRYASSSPALHLDQYNQFEDYVRRNIPAARLEEIHSQKQASRRSLTTEGFQGNRIHFHLIDKDGDNILSVPGYCHRDRIQVGDIEYHRKSAGKHEANLLMYELIQYVMLQNAKYRLDLGKGRGWNFDWANMHRSKYTFERSSVHNE